MRGEKCLNFFFSWRRYPGTRNLDLKETFSSGHGSVQINSGSVDNLEMTIFWGECDLLKRITRISKQDRLFSCRFTVSAPSQPLEGCTCHTAKTQYRKLETNILRKGTAQLQSQFLHSCFCDRFTFSRDRSACFAVGK
jgi:hypothetical protein